MSVAVAYDEDLAGRVRELISAEVGVTERAEACGPQGVHRRRHLVLGRHPRHDLSATWLVCW